MSPQQVERTVALMWENLGRGLGEILATWPWQNKNNRIRKSVARHVRIYGVKTVAKLLKKHPRAIFIGAHMANWEVQILSIALMGIKGGVVYRHANNPWINRYIIWARKRSGLVQVPKGPQGSKVILALLKKNQSVCMLVDQKMNDGKKLRFFNQHAMTVTAPARLALKYNLPLIPLTIQRLKDHSYRVRFHPPLTVTSAKSRDPHALMQAANDFFEAHIRARPHEWLWLHNRWP